MVIGKANFEHLKSLANGLGALLKTEDGQAWLASVVPKDSETGKGLNEKLMRIVTDDREKFLDDDDDSKYDEFGDLLAEAEEYFKARIAMYTRVLKDVEHGPEVQQQLCVLIGGLDDLFRRGYKNIFDKELGILYDAHVKAGAAAHNELAMTAVRP